MKGFQQATVSKQNDHYRLLSAKDKESQNGHLFG